MKKPPTTSRFSLALVLALACGHLLACTGHRTYGGSDVLSPAHPRSAQPAKDNNLTIGGMREHCRMMKVQKDKMMEDLKAWDIELTEQVARMNSAPEDQKLGLLASIVTRMVEQRTVMNERKAKMQEDMMKHMMEHMHMGREAMPQCPMMNGRKGTGEPSPGTHEGH